MAVPEAFFEVSATFSNAVAAYYEEAFRQQQKILEDHVQRLASWQSIAEGATEALFVAELEHSSILWTNEAMALLLGYDAKDLVGKRWQDITHLH